MKYISNNYHNTQPRQTDIIPRSRGCGRPQATCDFQRIVVVASSILNAFNIVNPFVALARAHATQHIFYDCRSLSVTVAALHTRAVRQRWLRRDEAAGACVNARATRMRHYNYFYVECTFAHVHFVCIAALTYSSSRRVYRIKCIFYVSRV